MEVPKILRKAQRQHRHNYGDDELIPAFDFEETIKIVNELEAKIEQLQNTSSNSDYEKYLEKFCDLLNDDDCFDWHGDVSLFIDKYKQHFA